MKYKERIVTGTFQKWYCRYKSGHINCSYYANKFNLYQFAVYIYAFCAPCFVTTDKPGTS